MTGWLLGTLFATSALMVLVLALREPVRRHFGPSVAYALWLLPAGRMVLPSFTRTVERIVPASPRIDHSAAAAVTSLATPAPDAVPSLPEILLAAWAAGAILMLLWGLRSYLVQRRLILAGGEEIDRIGAIRLIRSPHVRGPLAFGFLDRVIIVPLDFDRRFSAREQGLALAHELEHHRCGDLIINVAAFAMLCVQWFNPLAWAAHAAFRFDQEAACDARVLNRARGADRSAYAEAIAKAASGATPLFVGALDRPSTLSRRLTIMTHACNAQRRRLGLGLVGAATLIVLPVSATRAVQYVDRPNALSPSSATPSAPALAAQPFRPLPLLSAAASDAAAPLVAAAVAPAAAPVGAASEDHGYVLPGGVTLGRGDVAFFANDDVVIHGRAKHLEQLTRAERAELRVSIAKSLRDIERERAALPARLAEARREVERIRSGAYKRELLQDREDLRRDLADVDAEAAEMRASGEDPQKRKAEILADLREAEAVDIDKEIREALEEADPDKIVNELRTDEAQMIRMRAKLDQLDREGR